MKKTNWIITLLLTTALLCSCGGTDKGVPAEGNPAQSEGSTVSVSEPEKEAVSETVSDTVSANGFTVKIVALHSAKDSNGEPIAAAEFLFTNENTEPATFMNVVQMTAFQNGIELHKDEMFLGRDYDWDSYYTEIKDGAAIPIFRAIPLQNENDPVNIRINLMDNSNGTVAASTSLTMNLIAEENEGVVEPTSETIDVQDSEPISSGGFTVSFVAVHKTKETEGDPMAVAEFLFTNENATPDSFNSIARVNAFQNGIELSKDTMYLGSAYDWNTFHTKIKDGATITVYYPIPLQNEEDPIDIEVDLIDKQTWKDAASMAVTIELSSSEDASENEEMENTNSQIAEGQEMETISSDGYTVSIVALHKTNDSNGNPIAAAEFLFTNENAEPASLTSVARVTAFQNGIELHKDEMFLERDYDWNTFHTEIKDGATISVFRALPLQNETDPVDITVDLIDTSNWTVSSSMTVQMDLND